LSGIVLGGGRAVALVKNAAGDTLMVHAGETVDGWTIVGIGPRQIVIARDGAQQTVALEFGTAKAQASGGPSAAAVGSAGTTASPSFDGLAAASRLGLPQANIPLGSPLTPPR
jgi:DNA-binding beta-propeller fold protein YncE